MNGLVDIKLVLTQILGFIVFVTILSRFAWKPILAGLEARRAKIEGQFDDAKRSKADADQLKAKYEQELRNIDAQARQKIQEGVAEGQRVATEIRRGDGGPDDAFTVPADVKITEIQMRRR